MVKKHLLLGIVAASLFAGPSLAFADSRERALELNSEGQRLFAEGEYRAAARKFIAAYAEYPTPELKLAESLAWYKDGNCSAAVEAANKFSTARPDASEVDKADMDYVRAECTIKGARGNLAAGDHDAAEADLLLAKELNKDGRADDSIAALERDIAAAKEAATAEVEPDVEDEVPDETADTEVVVEETVQPQARKGSTRRIIGWSLVGAGAAAGIAAGATYLSQAEKIDTNADECVGCNETVHAVNRASVVAAPVLGIIGFALVLWPDSEQQISVGPGPGDVGASFTLNF